jgi:hypothetical protein
MGGICKIVMTWEGGKYYILGEWDFWSVVRAEG